MLDARLTTPVKNLLRNVRNYFRGLFFYGNSRYCPVCDNHSRQFLPFGITETREDALCPHCGSLERHRLLWLFVTSKTDLFEKQARSVLHVAPETCLEPRFRRRLGNNYLTADLFNPCVDVAMDITDIQYPDESFDVIYCSHVLEHVPDDRAAMKEFYRVLDSDGWAILLVPIIAEKTFEDPFVTDPQERRKLFGQEDHVRSYGPDYVDRLRDAGFDVTTVQVADLVDREAAVSMGLTAASGDIFYCTK